LGEFEGELEPDTWYSLPTLHPLENKNMTIYSDPLGAIEAYWHEKHQHYYIKLKDNKSRSVKLAYIWNQNKSYKDSPTLDAELAISPHLLHEKIREKIKLRFETHPKLQFLFDDNLSVADKYQALLNYFNDENDKFTSKKIPVSSNKKIEKLLNIIQYKAGACRHRANAFMLLARYMGISANIINNPKHAFCDIPFISKGKITWKSLDLGGTSANYINDAVLSSYKSDLADTTILEEQKQELDILDINPDRKLRAISPEEKETLQQYNVAFDNRIQENVLNSNSQIINNKKVLIQLKKNHNPFDVSEKIRDTIKDKNDFLYIDKPSDFHLYLNAWQYRKNKFSSVPGPLHKLLKVGGTVVVNWSNFSANDVMRYKSVWDEVPTLSGFSADKLNVIGLNDNNQNATSAFLTRANRYVLGEQFLQKAEELKAEIPANKIFSIDLFSLPNWRQKLYGEEKRDGKKVSLAQSQFIAEIRKTQLDPYSTTPVTIEIINPPNDRDFVTLMHRLSKERRILYQGDWLHIPSRVKFILRNKPHNNKLPNVAIETNNQNFLNHDRIYLGLYNLYECRQCKDASQSTLLDLYDNNTVFYVTESIPDEFWQELQVRIKNDFPHKNFTFLLAPGVSVDGHHIENDQADYLESKVENKTIYTSNDPDFFSVQLAESTQATIIDVNPQMNLSDLMARMQVTSGGMFAYAEHDLLKALRNGKCFVLNGEISHALYQWLLPLLSEKPHIHLNNERIGIAQQQLMLVMPETARLNLKLFHEDNHQYDLDDYAELFNHSNEFKQIRQFYELAQTVPHHGDGMPASPLLSHQRITRMIEKLKLKSEFHTHNPVKGLFHYDYRKDSEEYAYLNVMGKCVFRPDDESAPRFDKLKLLVHRFDIHSSTKLQEHIWQILNCFNGSQLKKILGKRIDQMDFHALDPQKIEVIYQEIKALLHHPSTKIKKSDKLAKQLKSALAKDNAIVFIKGSTGVGKTHTLKKTLGNYYNFKEIEAWLNNTSNKDKYLFIDEANMADPNFWDFLKGLSRKPPHIEYKGKIYSNLSPQHKIVVLGNPEHYQYRHYHEFLQNYAETIYFKIDDDYIEKNILRDIFPEKLQQQQFTKPLLRAMHLIEHYNPYFVTSIRDVKSLASRVLTLVGNKKDDIDLRQAIFEACIGEFSPVIKNSQERKNFIDELQIVCQATSKAVALKSPLIPITPNFKITREKSYLVQSIMQDLAIRQQVIDKKLNNNHYYKPIIILDGESGWGKSTLLEAILQGNQFEKESSHPQKKYYVITAGSSGVEEIITQAYREGAIVILDEINLDPHLEKFLIDLEETEPDCPGFMVFSSKNASVEADRKSLSSALLNRSHMMYVDSFTTNELVNIARESHIANPDQFVMSYLQRKEEFPDLVNMRTFYEVLASSRKSFFDTSNTFKPADAQVKIKFMEVASFCMEFAKNFSENTKELYIDQVYSKINVFKETFAELSDKIDERNNTLDKLKESYLEQKEIQGSQRALSLRMKMRLNYCAGRIKKA
jgi:tRNA A37 threonylcarbamoyladenosine biosynthesis protein TsaE